ncbi:MAG: autotransporter outer membrane beta-barrel domain-containing protein [Cyanobacteria bacterium J06607_17]
MITRFGDRLARLASLTLGVLTASVAVAMAAQMPANAQAAYGSYIGIGPAFGDGEIGVAINGRYNILELPISIRGAAFLGEGSAFVPTVSYDYPLNFSTEIFVGAGVAFASEGSVMGDGTAFVLQPGVDFIMDNNLVFYGNAVVPIGGDTNTAIQGGIGYQF